jgi:hypothetical protein
MEQIIKNIIENGAAAAGVSVQITNIKATIYLNERSEGFCDCCCKNIPPKKLIRHSYSASRGDTKMTLVSFLCAKCVAS